MNSLKIGCFCCALVKNMFASCFSELWIVKCFYHLKEAEKYQGSYSTDVLPSTKIQFCTVRMFKSTSFTHASGVMNHTFLYWNWFSLLCENNTILPLPSSRTLFVFCNTHCHMLAAVRDWWCLQICFKGCDKNFC